MNASTERTLLALLLALEKLDITALSEDEQLTLRQVGLQLCYQSHSWEDIKARLLNIIEGNSFLQQQYEAAESQLNDQDDTILQDLLPAETTLQQEIPDFQSSQAVLTRESFPVNSQPETNSPGETKNVTLPYVIGRILARQPVETVKKKVPLLERIKQRMRPKDDQQSQT